MEDKKRLEREFLLKKLCNTCGEINCSECPYPFDMGLNVVKIANSNKERVNSEKLQNEYNQYLKVMEGYRNLDKTVKCRHGKAKTQTAFKQLEDSNLEIAEVICLECQQFIGFVYRKIKTVRQEKIIAKFLIYAVDKNEYTTEKRRV